MSGSFIQRSRHGTVYYFRRRVPRELRGRLGRVHFYASLHTEELAEAKRRARAMAVVTDRLFTELRYMQGGKDDDSLKLDYGVVVDWDPLSRKPRVTADNVKPGEEESVTQLAKLLLGAVDDAGARAPVPPAAGEAKQPETPTVREAIAAKLASPDLKPTTRKEYKRAFALFAERMGGDTRLADLPQERFAEFADYVAALPDLAPKTKGSLIVAAGTLYSFYNSRNSAVPKITTKGLKPKRVGPPLRRRGFTLEELEVLFRNALQYREREPAKWWITVVPVFLGGRVEELTQAHVEGDFLCDPKSGVHYLKIDEAGPKIGEGQSSPKSVKTEAGWRKVPIHPALIDAGFLDFVAGERAAGAITPFQRQWAAHRDADLGLVKHSHAISKWGGRELKKLKAEGKVPNDESTVYFHSMRHSFVTLLAAAGVDHEWRSALAGHEFGQINAKVYNQAKHDVAVTLPIIERGLEKLADMFGRIA
jgi:hypothetical protein